jgi:glycosyltransferase involved in cell wall biosynthesis
MRSAVPRNPRVTLGVTTYNVERYLAGALDSLLAQDFADFEIVVCDNASSDGTWDILTEYAGKDSRFRIHRNPENLGEAGNFRRVVSLARGEFFRICAHDDLAAPGLLSACVAALDANPGAVLAFPSTVLIDGEGAEIGPWEDQLDLRQPGAAARVAGYARKWNICNEVFGLVRTGVLRQTRLFGPFLSSDVRMLHELALRGEFVQLPERLFYRRMHATVTFGAGRDTGEVLEWLEPGARSKPMKSVNSHHSRMTWETTKALMNAGDVPFGRRTTGTAAFLTAWGARRGRARLGRLRRRLTGTPIAPPPWERA